MKLLNCVYVLFLGGLLVTPCLAAADKKMKSEPKQIAGMTCGDTPFEFFTTDEYLGRDELSGCPKIYEKIGFKYFFNVNGQLYRIDRVAKNSELQTFNKKYGEPSQVRKTGDERYESVVNTWDGKNTQIIFRTMTRSDTGKATKTSSVSYFCKNIEKPEQFTCNETDVARQKDRIDPFIQSLGIDFSAEAPPQGQPREDYLATIMKNAQAIGLPKPDSAFFSRKTDTVFDSVCLTYKQSDTNAVKKVIFQKVGDIAIPSMGATLIGNKNTIIISVSHNLKNDGKALKFNVCASENVNWLPN